MLIRFGWFVACVGMALVVAGLLTLLLPLAIPGIVLALVGLMLVRRGRHAESGGQRRHRGDHGQGGVSDASSGASSGGHSGAAAGGIVAGGGAFAGAGASGGWGEGGRGDSGDGHGDGGGHGGGDGGGAGGDGGGGDS